MTTQLRKNLEEIGLKGPLLDKVVREIDKHSDEPELLKLDRAAHLAGVSHSFLQKQIRLGLGPHVTRIGNTSRIARQDLLDWINRWRHPTGEDAQRVAEAAARLSRRAQLAGQSQGSGRPRVA